MGRASLRHNGWSKPAALALSAGVFLFCLVEPSALIGIYQSALRASFFTAFVSVGSFMLTLKTFVLIKMKEGMYDSPKYKRRFQRSVLNGNKDPHYAPIRRLGGILFLAIASAYATSVAQLSIGLWGSRWAAIICICLAVFTIGVLITCLHLVHVNLQDWFALLEEPEPSPDPED